MRKEDSKLVRSLRWVLALEAMARMPGRSPRFSPVEFLILYRKIPSRKPEYTHAVRNRTAADEWVKYGVKYGVRAIQGRGIIT